jgi:hypothetical protein
VSASTHLPSHVRGFAPEEHAQAPLLHTLPSPVTPSQSWQALPHAWGLFLAFTHPPVHRSGVVPPHCNWQTPPWQTSPDAHAWPQFPQFRTSTSASTQRPAQVTGLAPVAHTHVPAWQTLPIPVLVSHWMQAAPQAAGLVWAFTQASAQRCGVFPPHCSWHVPPLHTSPYAHPFPHCPQ